MAYKAVDLLVDDTGDLVIDSTNDIKLATASETLQQDVLFRLRTGHLDFSPKPYIGADLGSFIGEPNNERTSAYIKEHVNISLTQDNRIIPSTLYVETIPIAIDKVHVVVIISDIIGETSTNVVVTDTLDLHLSGSDESILEVDI